MSEVQKRTVCGVTVSSAAKTQPAGLGLGRNAAWMFLGQVGSAVGQWAILIILARLGGPALVGQFTLALAIVTPMIVFSQLQMREIQAVDATCRYTFADYWAVRVVTTVLALVAITVVAALGGYPVAVAAVIAAVGLTRAVESLSDVYYGFAQRRERLDRIAQSMLLRGIIGCAALGLVLALTGSLIAGLLAQASVAAAVWGLFDRRIASLCRDGNGAATVRCVYGAEAGRRRLRLAWLGMPAGGTLLLSTLNINVPRYVLEGSLGLESLGIFAALAHFVFAGQTVIGAVCQAASPRLANLFAQGEVGRFRRLLLQLCGTGALLGLAGTLVALLLGEPLLRLLYGPAFAAEAGLLFWIMVAGLLQYASVPLGYGLSAMHRFRVQLVLQGIVLGVNTLTCFFLVPRYGIAGAVGGWILAFACQGLLSVALNVCYLRHAVAGAPAAAEHDGGQGVARFRAFCATVGGGRLS
jgi:O-antigen/teichoic acid export membrane protein